MKKSITLLFDPQIDIAWKLCGDSHIYYVLNKFFDFINHPLKWQGEVYEIKLERVNPKPLLCGQPIQETTDFIVDRTSMWSNYYDCFMQSALNSLIGATNCNYTMRHFNKHHTCDVLARAMHPDDHFPTTVLLPEFNPLAPEQSNDLLLEVIEKYFNNHYPVLLKRAYESGGGADVYKVNNFEELYAKYTRSGWPVFHIQEFVEDFENHIRCMAIGPQILPMNFRMNVSYLEGYNPEVITIDSNNRALYERLGNYVKFINSYHRWTYASFEAFLKKGKIYPIDFANPHCDSRFYTLHVHFPWLICALVRWMTFCVVTNKSMRVDMEQQSIMEVLNNPNKLAIEKYEFCKHRSEAYFEAEKFNEFCAENWSNLDEQMIEFYDEHWSGVIDYAIQMSYFPKQKHEYYAEEYQKLMTQYFRPNAKEYLNYNIY